MDQVNSQQNQCSEMCYPAEISQTSWIAGTRILVNANFRFSSADYLCEATLHFWAFYAIQFCRYRHTSQGESLSSDGFDSQTPTISHYFGIIYCLTEKHERKTGSSYVRDFLSNTSTHAHWLRCWNRDFRLTSVNQKRLWPPTFAPVLGQHLWMCACWQVTRANIGLMRQLILNGADTHPGANFIEQRQTKIKRCVQSFAFHWADLE